MSMTPDRVAARVAGMIESIRSSGSKSFSEHNAHESLYYISQVCELGIISEAQRAELESAVHLALQTWDKLPGRGFWDENDIR
ncbi:hypothetical protein [Pseudomonas petrae]|uniref:Uncharacterized protein n=1 Tax=Pseudomonas petrae TaxID=2912190 RepID=A0ABS9ICP9_9PSED|nr:hypothetical protein [Pseudomonas petrae]MCF7532055.1 hypothetical protein [Pseudomonas petrae]MCF7537611.1 hypothetical protein [Pseudomonas petrae]MCF7545499.1 hypothetical protein [Pseudomonas petrae]